MWDDLWKNNRNSQKSWSSWYWKYAELGINDCAKHLFCKNFCCYVPEFFNSVLYSGILEYGANYRHIYFQLHLHWRTQREKISTDFQSNVETLKEKKIPYLFWSILHHSYSKLKTSQVFVVWYIAVMLWKLNLITSASDAWMIKSCCRGSFQLNEFVLNLPNFKTVTWILMQVSEKKFLSYEE